MHKYKFTSLCIGWVRRARVQVVESITYRDLVTAAAPAKCCAVCRVLARPSAVRCISRLPRHRSRSWAGLGWAGLGWLGWAGLGWAVTSTELISQFVW